MFMPWALENFPQLTLKKAGPVTFWPVAYDIFTLKFKEKILFYWSLLSLWVNLSVLCFSVII